MAEGLKALKNIKREAGFPYFSTCYDADMWREDFATVEKELKALEIIKKYIKLEGSELYTAMYIWELPQEEYDLLKEVL